jgi:nicotinamidase-related amidase
MDSERYALLVVDMQNGSCHPDGSFPKAGRAWKGR